MIETLERRTLRKVWWRVVPLLTVVLFFNYLDKVNLGYAALTMNPALGFSNTLFGAGAGFFAIGYALAAIPSTLALRRFGARRWIAIIAIAWAACSAATAFVKQPAQLLILRGLLGAAEAGFTPGAILYFSDWFPKQYRGRTLATFLLVYPVGLLLGGPLASGVLALDGWGGMAGWQWLFIIESLPTVGLAAVVLRRLTDRPAEARWLSEEERTWLTGCLADEARQERTPAETATPASQRASPHGTWAVFGQRKLWILATTNFTLSTAGIGALFFMPLVVHSLGFSVTATGLVTMLPGIAATLTLPLWGRYTDRAPRNEIAVATACLMLAVGLAATAYALPSLAALAWLCVAMVGFHGCLVSFWTLPTSALRGAGTATGVAFVNIVGNLGTFVGPFLLGWLADRTHGYAAGMLSLAGLGAVAAVIVATTRVSVAPAAGRVA